MKVPPPIYEAGIIGGYNIPSVTTPYNSITLEEMIARTKNVFDGQSIAVRLHPGDPIKAQPYNVTIETCPLVEFILKCKRIVCNASNVSYEAALYGKIPYDLGWSQFGFAVNTSIEKLEDLPMTKSALNFIAFGALIPWELLKNIEYLRFRLSNPSEREIYLYHLQYYLSSCNIKDEYMPTRFQKVMEKVKNFENSFHEPYLIEDTVWSGRNSIAVKEIEINRLLKTIEVLEKSKSNIIEEMKNSTCRFQEEQSASLQKNQQLENEKEQLIADKNTLELLCKEKEYKLQNLESLCKEKEFELQELLNSTCFRITKPMRVVGDLLRKII